MNQVNQPPFDPRTSSLDPRTDPRTDQPSSAGSTRAGVIDRPSSPSSAVKPPTEQNAAGPYEDVLFHGLDAEQFKSRWHEIQGEFVDSPEQAVKQADELVKSVVQKLESEFSNARAKLEQAWGKDAQPSTEDLRKALQRYRSFFNRLLSV